MAESAHVILSECVLELSCDPGEIAARTRVTNKCANGPLITRTTAMDRDTDMGA